MMILKLAAEAPTPCKIHVAPAPLCGLVDFHRCSEMPDGKRLPLSSIPIYYRRCETCGFLFTDAFDCWSEAEFKAYIYHVAFRTLPVFAKHLLKQAPSALAS